MTPCQTRAMLSIEVTSRILQYTWQSFGDMGSQLLVCTCWCKEIILVAVPDQLLITILNLNKFPRASTRASRFRRVPKWIQIPWRECGWMNFRVFRQVQRLTQGWSLIFEHEDHIPLDLIVEGLLRTIHTSFVRWRPVVVRKTLESMGHATSESLGIMSPPCKMQVFDYWWCASIHNIFNLKNILEVLIQTNRQHVRFSTFPEW